jgi:hypothetical protein
MPGDLLIPEMLRPFRSLPVINRVQQAGEVFADLGVNRRIDSIRWGLTPVPSRG